MFNEVNVTRAIDTSGSDIKAVVGTLGGRITYEYTGYGFLLKFMRVVRFEPGIAKTPKATEFKIIGFGAKESRVWGSVVKGRCRQAVYEIYGGSARI